MEYYIKQLDHVTWELAKFDDGSEQPLAIYQVTSYGGQWKCNCPAGANKRRCKHLGFVQMWRNLSPEQKTRAWVHHE